MQRQNRLFVFKVKGLLVDSNQLHVQSINKMPLMQKVLLKDKQDFCLFPPGTLRFTDRVEVRFVISFSSPPSGLDDTDAFDSRNSDQTQVCLMRVKEEKKNHVSPCAFTIEERCSH